MEETAEETAVDGEEDFAEEIVVVAVDLEVAEVLETVAEVVPVVVEHQEDAVVVEVVV